MPRIPSPAVPWLAATRVHAAIPTALFTLLAALLCSSTAAAAPGPAGCGSGSWIAGTVDLCAGELVYRDYIYDDYGAQGLDSPPTTGSLSNPTGTQSYPAPNNVVNNYADLVALRLRVEGNQLHVSFELNSLFDPASTVAALAIDSDANLATGGGAWADLIALPDFSIPVQSNGWDELHLFSTGDPATNRIEGTIPLPPGTQWRVQAVTAVASTRAVMNVAFRGTDETGTWFEDLQAAALQSADISDFGHFVDVADLTGGVTERAVVGPGLYERVYISDYTIAVDPGGDFVYDSGAEGVNYDSIAGRGASDAGAFSQTFHFVGRHQPYGLYIPQPSPGVDANGLQLVLHGFSANHTSLIGQPGMQDIVGEASDRILVVPLGRGPEGFYSDISERDVLDVMTDVLANYDVDLDRVFSGGYSMGGYGGMRMAAFYPDRFAGHISWVGYPGDACGQPDVNRCHAGEVGIPAELMGNLREVFGSFMYAGADELVNSAQGLWLRGILADLGVPHIFFYHPAAEHFTFALADDWLKETAHTQFLPDLSKRTRRSQPPRVTYRTEPWADAPELGIVHDRAYWVSEIVGVETGERDYVDVDVFSYGCGGEERIFTEQLPGAGSDPVPWESQHVSASLDGQGTPFVQQHRLEALLSNVASFRVDSSPGGACLPADEDVDYEVTTDGPGTIQLSDGRVINLPTPGTHQGTLLPEASLSGGALPALALLVGLSRRSRARQAR